MKFRVAVIGTEAYSHSRSTELTVNALALKNVQIHQNLAQQKESARKDSEFLSQNREEAGNPEAYSVDHKIRTASINIRISKEPSQVSAQQPPQAKINGAIRESRPESKLESRPESKLESKVPANRLAADDRDLEQPGNAQKLEENAPLRVDATSSPADEDRYYSARLQSVLANKPGASTKLLNITLRSQDKSAQFQIQHQHQLALEYMKLLAVAHACVI